MEKETYAPKPAEFYLRGNPIEVSDHFDQVGHSFPKLLTVTPEHVNAMVSALNHKHSLVRTRAAVVFGKIGHSEALQPLRTALKAENDDLAQMAMQTAIRNIEKSLKT